VAGAIDRSSINPVDTQFQRPMNGGDGLAVILSAPGELPTRAADRPGAEADGRDE